MKNVRVLCAEWSLRSFRDELSCLNIQNKILLNSALKCFSDLGILDKKMDGYSCEKLPKTEEGHTGIKISYSELFHQSSKLETFSPALYLLAIINEFLDKKADLKKLNGSVARGLRTLTSFIREPDFAYGLETYLRTHDPKITTTLNHKQDGKDHTDVLLKFKDCDYRIWLYQLSSRGLPHDIERVSGKRGELPSGIHILCPLRTEVAISYDSLLKKIERLNSKNLSDLALLTDCSIKAIKKRQQLETRINKNIDLLTSLNLHKSIEHDKCCEELDIVNGWYFYSEKHIQRITEKIVTSSSFDDYSEVKTILKGPEEYLSTFKMFKK
jgi:hypothetical protein